MEDEYDLEEYICPIAGATPICYVDRESEECRKCKEEFIRSEIDHEQKRIRNDSRGNE